MYIYGVVLKWLQSFDKVHNPIKVVGVIFNVDEEIRQSQTLKMVSRRFCLLKTYNRLAYSKYNYWYMLEITILQKHLW